MVVQALPSDSASSKLGVLFFGGGASEAQESHQEPLEPMKEVTDQQGKE